MPPAPGRNTVLEMNFLMMLMPLKGPAGSGSGSIFSPDKSRNKYPQRGSIRDASGSRRYCCARWRAGRCANAQGRNDAAANRQQAVRNKQKERGKKIGSHELAA
jgi:hypothetical protein